MEKSMEYALSQLLSSNGYISVNKSLIKKVGLNCAVMIGELLSEYNYWYEQNKLEDEMFFSTRENLEENTGLNEYLQRKTFADLKSFGLVDVVKKGLPAKNYYKINFDTLYSMFSTSTSKFEELEVQNLQINNNKYNNNNSNNIITKNSNNNSATPFEFGKKKAPKQNLYSKCVSMIDDFTDDKELRELLVKYLTMMLAISGEKGTAFYSNNFKGKLRMLSSLPKNDWKAIVQKTLTMGWQGFYALEVSKGKENIVTNRITEENLDDYIELQQRWLDELERDGKQTKF